MTRYLPRDLPRDLPKELARALPLPVPPTYKPRSQVGFLRSSEDFTGGHSRRAPDNCAPCRWNVAWSNRRGFCAWLNSADTHVW